MKKLGKLTLKELENTAMVMRSVEEQKLVVGGGVLVSSKMMDWGPGGSGAGIQLSSTYFGGSLTNMLPEISCTAQKTYVYDPSNDRYANQTPIGPTPTQQYSQACAEGYTQAAQAIAFGTAVAVYSALEVWCIMTGKASAGTQWAITPDQYGGGVNNTTSVYNSK